MDQYLGDLVAELDEQVLLVGSEGLGVASGVSVVPAAHVDLLDLENVVDGPDDAQQAADHDHDDLHGETHRRVAGGTRLQVL